MKVLSDIVGELIDKGYTLSFDSLEQITFELTDNTAEQLPAVDFSVDEVYRCREHQHDADVIYVFAISSVKYKMKGIVINLIASENTMSLGELYQTLKERISTWWKIRKKNSK